MQITILGGGGFLGRKLAERLAKDGALGGEAVTGLTLFDLAQPAPVEAPFPVRCLAGDITEDAALQQAIPDG
ncbi:MAG TPA: NAD-dependent epimerase/dehydratase family protein, partial [Roseomonas sp.]